MALSIIGLTGMTDPNGTPLSSDLMKSIKDLLTPLGIKAIVTYNEGRSGILRKFRENPPRG